ncbi:hypothetical protein K2173_002050 [Erythroxylum novogranatense]|uniref:Uncharacterized protein n=1 Tax=Erythroxylum novogranatense TaxID=1862640 RepID=A0AAV8SPF8_9ROSI|nr:hypothetical protein K2173_002050 [Erythroxylum novogranatense]
MWQLLVAAAVAGSTTLVAKHLLLSDKFEEEQRTENHELVSSEFQSPEVTNKCGYESNEEIFRFSSSGSSGKRTKGSRKKSGISGRRLKYGVANQRSEGDGAERSGRRFGVCLKKRKTAKRVLGSSSSKDGSLFDWGLGVGIMYMISAEKAEINKLSMAMDETSKVVQELRADLFRRKSKRFLANSDNEHLHLELNGRKVGAKDANKIKLSELSMTDDAECPSSVLTEELVPDVKEMDELEAELESELQKLPWSPSEALDDNVMKQNLDKAEISSGEADQETAISYQCHGVSPSELDQKLCHVLIERQGNQIAGLESELHLAQSKLCEKEAELQALKDCVRRLTEISLSSLSDDETEVQVRQQWTSEGHNSSNIGSEFKNSVVGMKRPITSA